jgi:hypothetical protein
MTTSIEPKAAAPSAQEHDPAARVAGRFSVLDLLGRGGMGEVYRVRDEVTGRELALKRLRRDRGGLTRSLALFEREFHTLAQLAHPCIISVYDYGVDAEGAYYTMELLAGADLRRRGKLEWRLCCAVLRDVASALAVIHSRRWLHRDPSPRNVIYAGLGGRAKLIDFGAMAPLGVARSVVGTPPLVPPEALQQQALDARADLYALGALAYFLLTERHAYPALDFDELPDLWRSAPRAPHRVVPEIPPALSQLVLQLLSLDRGARPPCASDVIERLGALLGDSESTGPEVAAAYLTTPKLVGRERSLVQARKQMVKTLRGKGSALLIEGPDGVGRSRFLDACVLEAKLLGARVIRAGASDGARGDYGVAAVLAEQLLEVAPEQAAHAARLQRSLLGTVVPQLADAGADPAFRPERRHLQTALRDWFRAVARSVGLVVAVDDFERIDEPSAALVASFVHRNERRKLVVLASVRADAQSTPAIDLLRTSSQRIALAPLLEIESEALLHSVFGGSHEFVPIAHRLHDLSAGNPARLMQLAEHLVQQGHVRHVAGSWIMPARMADDAIPATFDAALSLCIEQLDPDALELGRTLALTDPPSIPLERYAELCSHADHARIFRALGTLTVASILQPEGERYRFAHPRWPELLAEHTPESTRREMHARLYKVIEGTADPVRLAYHLLGSGQEERGAELLLGLRAQPGIMSEQLLLILERATEACRLLGSSRRKQLGLRSSLVDAACLLIRQDVFERHAPGVIAELMAQSGLSDYAALAHVPAEARLPQAFAAAKARHDAAPEHNRPYPALEAILELARLSNACCALAHGAMDPGLLDALPSLTPFLPLSPAIFIVQTLNEGVRMLQSGRRRDGHEAVCRALERMEQPDRAAMPESVFARTRNILNLALAESEASNGDPRALQRLGTLLETPGYRAEAWRWYANYHLMQGKLSEASRSERRAELVLLQDGERQFGEGRAFVTQANAYWLSQDLDGLKQVADRIERLARQRPRWRPAAQLVLAYTLSVKGNHAGAHAAIEAVLPFAVPGTHLLSPAISAAHVGTLAAIGRAHDAAEAGLAALRAFTEHGYKAFDRRVLARETAEALALSGRFEQARALADGALDEALGAGTGGIALGVCYETRARVAMLMSDEAGTQHWLERCKQLYAQADSPALSAKLGRLLQQARPERGAGESDRAHLLGAGANDPLVGLATEWSRMKECVSANERARCALIMLLEHGGASEGHLFGLLGGAFTDLASVPEQPPDTALLEDVAKHIEARLRAVHTTAVTQNTRDSSATGEAGRELSKRFHVILLRASEDTEPVVVAIALIPRGGLLNQPPAKLLGLLADSLLSHDDVDPIM